MALQNLGYGFVLVLLHKGLLPDFEARLSIFYSDFKPKGANDIDLVKIPNVDKGMLKNAINELEKMTQELP
jgi:hypothetical protein